IKPLKIYCPPKLKEIVDLQLKYSETTLQYPVEFIFTNPEKAEVLLDNQDIIIETIPLNHRISCTGFLFKEKKRLRKLIKDKLEQLAIPVEYYSALKKGADYIMPNGEVLKNDTLTTDSSEPKAYAYCSDTLYDEMYFKQINGVTLLYHEATFLNNMLDRAIETHHTTALQAGQVALITNAKKLLIGHFSARYKTLTELLDEARSVFPETELAIEGRTFIIGE
ncbi:MAG: ribonuclease, partial [Mucilaginibacter sp.]|nr:ribonuclease [Mucilaginibacter sp.]